MQMPGCWKTGSWDSRGVQVSGHSVPFYLMGWLGLAVRLQSGRRLYSLLGHMACQHPWQAQYEALQTCAGALDDPIQERRAWINGMLKTSGRSQSCSAATNRMVLECTCCAQAGSEKFFPILKEEDNLTGGRSAQALW
jgi:hypothetical protein